MVPPERRHRAMLILGRLRLLASRFGGIAIVYVFAMVVIASQQKIFGPLDMAVAGALVGTKPTPHLDRELTLVDLGSYPGHSWRSAVEFLSWVSDAVKNHKMYRPNEIVLDMYFSNAKYYNEPNISARDVVRAIRSLQSGEAKTQIYAAVNPYETGSTTYQDRFLENHESSIYDALAGSGHTEFTLTANGRIGWYKSAIREREGNDVFALPLVVHDEFSAPAGTIYPFIIGSDERTTYTFSDVKADPKILNDRIVIVGSTKTDTHSEVGGDAHSKVAGMVYTAWAINDRLRVSKAGHISLFYEPGFVSFLAAALSLVSALAFYASFRLVRALDRRLLVATVVGAAAPLAVLSVIVFVSDLYNIIFVHLTFAFVAIVISSLALWYGGRLQIRYDRIVAGFADGWTKIQRHADVFVSYSRDDENIAWVEERIVKPLRNARRYNGAKLDVFFDLQQIGSGMNWYKTIVDALWGSRVMIAVYSPRYFERTMCVEELLTAMRRGVNDPTFKILPVSRMGAAIPPMFAGFQIIDTVERPNFIDDIVVSLCALDSNDAASAEDDRERVKTHVQKTP